MTFLRSGSPYDSSRTHTVWMIAAGKDRLHMRNGHVQSMQLTSTTDAPLTRDDLTKRPLRIVSFDAGILLGSRRMPVSFNSMSPRSRNDTVRII